MADAFISYRRDPSAMAASLVQEKLKNKHNIDAYLDVNRADSTRVQFPQRLMQAIGDAPTFILMLADTTLESEWVRKEIQRAYELQKHCIPIFQESYKPTDISDPAIDYVLSFDGVHLLDKKNIYIDVAIQQIADLVVKSSGVQTPPIVVTPQKPQIAIPPKPKIILPQPFDWCYIPSGNVKLTPDDYNKNIYIQRDTIVDVFSFWMSKYPVTNAQFREFVDDGGYQNEKWWTSDGFDHVKYKPWTSPDFWENSRWNKNDYPVVGVSWYEALAFCTWLQYKTGNKIMLPTDAMWQRAAQGDDGRIYPWGDEWNGGFCNSRVPPNFNTKTTSVIEYQNIGHSPFNVVDMAGNTFEWCLTTYKNGSNDLNDRTSRIARGGSWYHDLASQFTTTFRSPNYPYLRYSFIGFRIACQIDPT